MNIIVFLIMGAIIGWLAGVIVKGRGFGAIGNIIVGIIGAVIGGMLFGSFGLSGGSFGGFVAAVIGAIIFIGLVSFIKKESV